ncbi:RHS repeat-associated core domain-containing protein [Verrucomicrobium sp. GAS474]|uniref:RHS repeat-associated core domain-containing protein n=1 Tax=Verrucomicrobium sp. GAS474 TaxID=1882831 RepID=UPI000B81A565|nr:RHS repeat-associated core domain-containing protein [Verrucomicrobium sp. GAS474]
MALEIEFIPDPCQPCKCPCDDPSGQNCCPASDATSNSVELATGRFVFEQELLSLSGVGSGSWSFGLNYKSNYAIDSILGKNFAYPQYLHLERLSTVEGLTNMQLVTNQLTRAIFIDNGDGTYSSPAGNNTGGVLTYADEVFTLTASDGSVTKFMGLYYGTEGCPFSMVDRYGNSQTLSWSFFYDLSGHYVPQLLSVTDAYERVITYTYHDSGTPGAGRLKQITDFLGRQLDFQYDSGSRLVAVVTPSILKAAPGNTFPGGTAYVFQYDSGNADPERRDDLIRIWYPNQTQPYLDVETRTVNVQAVYQNATPRYQVTYGQDPTNVDTYGKVLTETVGDPQNGVGGTALFNYTTTDLPSNLIDPSAPITSRTTHTDRNGNLTIYDFNAYWTTSRLEVQTNRGKNSLEITPPTLPPNASPYVTWTKFTAQNQPSLIVYPEGNSVAYTYETGVIPGFSSPYVARRGLLLSETRLPGNTLGIPHRSGSNGQTELTKRYFYDPLFNQLCATIEERGNPIDGSSTYFTPQNGGTTPTNSDRSRYATIQTFDYQKNQLATVTGNAGLQALLGLDATQIAALITYVDTQMKATDGTGGLPGGFPLNLGDINGDGTGDGASSGLPAAPLLGNVLRTVHPPVLLVGGTTQNRVELFTVNLRGQTTTATDPEGNLTVTVRYPENDPDGDGLNIAPGLTTRQYGLVREVHVDADPDQVMSLLGASADLVAFTSGLIPRTNTPGIYQDLITRYEGSSGCATCAYDAMGNALNETDPRGFTTVYDRNELGAIYRTTSPEPYAFRVETYYDANRNVIRVDTEDRQPLYDSIDPTSSGYGHFSPTGSGATAHVPMTSGPGGALRPGWFSNLMAYDLLDNKIEEDIDATGSTPASLLTRYAYDANQNLVQITKPAGNTVEYDYDERNLRIAERVGYDPADPATHPGAVTVNSYDGNGNLVNVIAPVNRGGTGTALTAYIMNAFGSGSQLVATGDWTVQNTYDGFDRLVKTTDAVGGLTNNTYDPAANLVAQQKQGTIGGATPTDRTGTGNTPLSNTVLRYDEASRTYERQQDVFLATGATLGSGRDVAQAGGGLAANSTANNHTGSATLTSGGSSYVLTRTVYDATGRAAATLTDNTAQTSYAYDGANRRLLSTDPLGNQTAIQYDGNGNPVRSTSVEVCTITLPTVPNETFTTFTWYDSLNRPVVQGGQGADGQLTANLGLCCPWQGLPSTLFSLSGYDSRGNLVSAVDPKQNVVLSEYDGASRLVETLQQLRQAGQGSNPPEANQSFLPAGGGNIRTGYVYDANSRLAELLDDRDAATVYRYDLLDRQVTKTLADGSLSTNAYNLAGDLTGYTDENGSAFAFTVDALGRRTAVAITLATGVLGTTAQTFQYDGLGRNTQAIDTVVSTSAEVDFIYDSLGHVLEEKQAYGGQTRYTTHNSWFSLVPAVVVYPSGTNSFGNGYDLLYRRNALVTTGASGTLDTVSWEFFGPSRIAETRWGGTSLIATQLNNDRTRSAIQTGWPTPAWGDQSSDRLGYDGAGRMITKRYLTGGLDGSGAYADTTALVGFTASHDRAGNKMYERALHAESRSSLYQPVADNGTWQTGYDSANRLRQYQRGVLSSAIFPYRAGPGASIATPLLLPGSERNRTYDLDGLGNWKKTDWTLDGYAATTTLTKEVRQHNYVNEITQVRATTGATVTNTPFTYDHGNNTDGIQGNGNTANDGVRTYQWDAFNRLIIVGKASGGATLATYVYDALGRRIQKAIADLGAGLGGLTGDIPAETTTYLYDGQQIIEDRNAAAPGDWTKIYFWGQYVDELMVMATPTNVYRLLSDLLYRSTALVKTDDNSIAEVYDTDAYGITLCYWRSSFDGQWFTDDDEPTNNPINTTIFTGRQFDPESQIYYYRARYYSPMAGRFLTPDPLGVVGGINLYEYVGGNPVTRVDFDGEYATAPSLIIPKPYILPPPIPVFPLPPDYPNVPPSPDTDPNYQKRKDCQNTAQQVRDACDKSCEPICDKKAKARCYAGCKNRYDTDLRDCNARYPSNPTYPPTRDPRVA